MIRTTFTALLIAGTTLTALPAAAQSRDVRDARQDLREERRDVQDARRYGDRRDVREERRDVRDARQDLREELREDRRADRRYRAARYVAPRGYVAGRNWGIGQVLPGSYFGERYVIGTPRNYGLAYAPSGYRWVRVGTDALLIARNGRVEGIRRGLFY